MENKNGKRLRYTNRMHIKNTKRLEYAEKLKKYRDKNGIIKIEEELTKVNSKSCTVKDFEEYIKKKNEINEILIEKYANKIFRKYKWYAYIEKNRTMDNLVLKIKEVFGGKAIICYGDWSDKLKTTPSMIKYMSTPNMGIKRKISEHMKIYNLDEFRTSILNNVTENKCENMYIPDKKGQMRKKHSILTYKMENNRMGCINRDRNAVKNMVKIVRYYMEHKERPLNYKRIKDCNPFIDS